MPYTLMGDPCLFDWSNHLLFTVTDLINDGSFLQRGSEGVGVLDLKLLPVSGIM